MTGAPATNWTALTLPANGAKVVAAAQGGGIYVSTDGGATWTQQDAPITNWSSVASSADGNKMVAAVQGGGIYVWQVPSLGIAVSDNNVVLSWPTNASGFLLQENSSLAGTNWVTLTNAPVVNVSNSEYEVILSPASVISFFRLRGP